MSTAKEEMINIISNLPDDTSYDELLRELALKRMINRGLSDSRQDKTISNEEMQRRIHSWQK